MNSRSSLLLVAVASLLLAKTAVAGLGWTLEECKKHYGEPTDSKQNELGLVEYSFSAHDLSITAMIDDHGTGTVVSVTYVCLAGLDDDLIDKILKQNGPQANWTRISNSSDPTTTLAFWRGSENDVLRYYAVLSQVTILGTPVKTLQVSLAKVSDLIDQHKKHAADDL
jgi:hypothetical protein